MDKVANQPVTLTPWPEAFAERYQEQGVWQQQNLAQWLQTRLEQYAQNTMLIGQGTNGEHWQQLTGQQLWQMSHNAAHRLQKMGLQQGDMVVVQMANNNAFVLTLFALVQLGVIPVMALPGHGQREIQQFIQLTQAKAWFVHGTAISFDCNTFGQQLQENLPHCQHIIVDGLAETPHLALASLFTSTAPLVEGESEPLLPGHGADAGAIAILLCSGGTTGIPKLIPRTHRDYIYNAQASARVCELNQEDRYLVALPAAHNFPLACPGILGAIDVGATVVMCPHPSPDSAFDCIQQQQITVTALVPTLVKSWLEYAALNAPPAESLRMLQVGGAKLDERMARRVSKELGCELQQVFGMAEGLLNFTRSRDPQMLTLKTQGRPMSTLDELRIVDEQGQDVPMGKCGELLTRGPYTIRGYYKDPLANQKSFTQDGYYCTGDRVRQLTTGHLIVEGRIKEVIRRAGEAVSVETLETILATHPDIQDIAVVGLPCEQLGEQACAALVVNQNNQSKPGLQQIRQYLLAEGVAQHMLPDSLAYVASIPLTAVGKVARKQLSTQIQRDKHSEQQGNTHL